MTISVQQINQSQLTDFVNGVVSGGSFSGFLQAYTTVSGYLGATVLYGTGGQQTVLTTFIFETSPSVQYSGVATGSAASQKWTEDKINYFINSLSGVVTGDYLTLDDRNQTALGYKVFTGAVGVGTPVVGADAVPLAFLTGVSGVLQSAISNVSVANAVTLGGTQTISGDKTFTISPTVPYPTATGDAVNKAYVDSLPVTGVVHTTGTETIDGVKTFVQSPVVPLATTYNQAAQKQQVDALAVSLSIGTGYGNFAGVSSIAGTTGIASGRVYMQSAGGVEILVCSDTITISGITPSTTQFYSARVPLVSGITGLSFIFPTGNPFTATPTVVPALEVSGANGSFFNYYLYNVTTGGFNMAFQTGIPGSGYVLNVNATPVSGGSGFMGIQGIAGLPGASFNYRGFWGAGNTYANRDWVYYQPNSASYACLNTHISTSFNAPAGTGSSFWGIMSSGVPGPTGYWVYRGNYDTGAVYANTQSVSLSGSTYGFTGTSITNVSPSSLTGGWTIVAKAGDLGYFINSGIITGNFVTVSFFLDPVSTGLSLGEAFVSSNFQYTGYALGCVTSGRQPDQGNFILTGSIYVRDFATNTKTPLQIFTLNTGVYNKFSGNFAYTITGMDRIGFDLTSTLSGITKLSVGLFGFGAG